MTDEEYENLIRDVFKRIITRYKPPNVPAIDLSISFDGDGFLIKTTLVSLNVHNTFVTSKETIDAAYNRALFIAEFLVTQTLQLVKALKQQGDLK